VPLTAGEKYNIKLEYFNEDERSGINLYWESDSLDLFSPGGEYIPQSQLWPVMGSSFLRTTRQPQTKTAAPVQASDVIVPTFVNNNIIVKSPREAYYTVHDLNGTLVNRGKIRQGVNYIPVNNRASGILILKVDNQLFKLIKQ
jgi:hypothetical protein